jgi:hypothetical protein
MALNRLQNRRLEGLVENQGSAKRSSSVTQEKVERVRPVRWRPTAVGTGTPPTSAFPTAAAAVYHAAASASALDETHGMVSCS